MSETILKCTGISKRFPGVKALDHVDFELRRGEVHALCGENGAGKSTLIKILTGIYTKDSGNILYNGKEINYKTVQECRENGISLIPQEIHLAQTLTVAENICMSEFPRTKTGMVDWKAMNEKAAGLQARLGLENQFTSKTVVGTLSMGHQQLVEIMKAISTDLKIIAFDEPTSSLSDEETEQLFRLIRELTNRGVSIIYVSHRLAEIFKICDRLTVYKDGGYVGTKDVKDVSTEEIVSMMTGREMLRFRREKSHATDEAMLEVSNLTWKNKVKDVSFSLKKGEILGLFGIVGSGRTETARLLFGLEKKHGGVIKINGRETGINSPAGAVAHKMGFVTEDRRGEGLSLVSSVKWNITMPFFGRLSKGLPLIRHGEEKAEAEKLKEDLNIKAPSLDTRAENLSGGNQQKIVVAKWLGANSEIMIFDEPTRGIDVGAKGEIYQLIDKLAAEGKSILLITSELPELMALSDRILVYRDGEINAELTDVSGLTEEMILGHAIMKNERNEAQ